MASQTTTRPKSLLSALKHALSALAIITLVATRPAASDQSSQAVEKLIDVGGYNLNFRIFQGESPAILLEAGGGMDSTEWNALAPRLARETSATVIPYAPPGFGK